LFCITRSLMPSNVLGLGSTGCAGCWSGCGSRSPSRRGSTRPLACSFLLPAASVRPGRRARRRLPFSLANRKGTSQIANSLTDAHQRRGRADHHPWAPPISAWVPASARPGRAGRRRPRIFSLPPLGASSPPRQELDAARPWLVFVEAVAEADGAGLDVLGEGRARAGQQGAGPRPRRTRVRRLFIPVSSCDMEPAVAATFGQRISQLAGTVMISGKATNSRSARCSATT
jgi:hypothetical protein